MRRRGGAFPEASSGPTLRVPARPPPRVGLGPGSPPGRLGFFRQTLREVTDRPPRTSPNPASGGCRPVCGLRAPGDPKAKALSPPQPRPSGSVVDARGVTPSVRCQQRPVRFQKLQIESRRVVRTRLSGHLYRPAQDAPPAPPSPRAGATSVKAGFFVFFSTVSRTSNSLGTEALRPQASRLPRTFFTAAQRPAALWLERAAAGLFQSPSRPCCRGRSPAAMGCSEGPPVFALLGRASCSRPVTRPSTSQESSAASFRGQPPWTGLCSCFLSSPRLLGCLLVCGAFPWEVLPSTGFPIPQLEGTEGGPSWGRPPNLLAARDPSVGLRDCPAPSLAPPCTWQVVGNQVPVFRKGSAVLAPTGSRLHLMREADSLPAPH